MHEVIQVFGPIAAMLAMAVVFAEGARRLGQPGVMGELFAGVLLGSSVLAVVDPHQPLIEGLKELGVVLLLFSIGLETDLRKLLKVGLASLTVALVGMIGPFLGGYFTCLAFGVDQTAAIVVGASLTATSVGITARVLSELGRLNDKESQIVLGAAIIDDVLGLVVLALIKSMADGEKATMIGMTTTAGVAIGFLAAALFVGQYFVRFIIWFVAKCTGPGVLIALSLALALATAYLADRCGSAAIIGAFAAGAVLGGSRRSREVEHALTPIGHFLVPIFFVGVGASVDWSTLNPFTPGNGLSLLLGFVLIVVAVATKFVAGLAAPGKGLNRWVIGVGMAPRGEVGLIFAQIGYQTKVIDDALLGAVTLMVIGSTLFAPPMLRMLLSAKGSAKSPLQGPSVPQSGTGEYLS